MGRQARQTERWLKAPRECDMGGLDEEGRVKRGDYNCSDEC